MANTPDTGSLGFGEDASGSPEPLKSTNGAAHTTLTSLISGEDQTNDVLHVEQGNGFVLRNVAASQTAWKLSDTNDNVLNGAAGDYINHIIVKISGGTSNLTLIDGASSYQLTVNAMITGHVPSTDAATHNQVIIIPVHASSENGGWTVTTQSNVLVVICGRFSDVA